MCVCAHKITSYLSQLTKNTRSHCLFNNFRLPRKFSEHSLLHYFVIAFHFVTLPFTICKQRFSSSSFSFLQFRVAFLFYSVGCVATYSAHHYSCLLSNQREHARSCASLLCMICTFYEIIEENQHVLNFNPSFHLNDVCVFWL